MPKAREGTKYKETHTIRKPSNSPYTVRNESMSQKRQLKHKISRFNLQFRLITKFKKISYGTSPILTPEDEKILVTWPKDCARKGFPRLKEDVQTSVPW